MLTNKDYNIILKPCPFCGQDNITVELSNDKPSSYRIYHCCKDGNFKKDGANVFIRTKWYKHLHEAINIWNNRKG